MTPLPRPRQQPQVEASIGGDLPAVRLGYGAMRVTGPGIWAEPPARHEAIGVLRRAVELGVNFIDTRRFVRP
jgi:pyridoxine 4-dehydrogenase